MSNIKVIDGGGATKYLLAGGAGTDPDPYVPIQDVRIQDQTTPQFSLYLGEMLDMALTLTSPSSENDESIDITSTTTPIIGNFLCLKEEELFSQVEIIGVTGGGPAYTIDLSMPMDHAYTAAANLCLMNCEMNVDGSSTTVDFSISPEGAAAGTDWDVTRMLISMTHDAEGDDGLFGGIEALTNGTYFRIEDGTNYNLFNAKENADFAIEGYDITYPSRSGKDGVYGTRSRITFNGPDKRGVVFRLAADTQDKFLACVRDSLIDLGRFRVKVQGQVVAP